MKKMFFYILFFACSNSEKVITKRKNEIISEVLTDSVFTHGIEGPAVNSKGDLFVVNFKKQGIIGILKRSKKEFETFIDDIAVNGVDIIEWDKKGKIINFKVMVRPFKAIDKVKEKMIESLEKISS